jgi:hypothetical protein
VNKPRIIEVLNMISQDMEDDAARFEGQPFTGKTMAEYNGCQGAAIAKLAEIIKVMLEEGGNDEKK